MSEALRLIGLFPGLASSKFEITSAKTAKYNCIAWAAGDDKKWWWPSIDYFWPEGVASSRSSEAFIKAFATLGYEVCDDGDLEEGFEKVALYTKPAGTVAHAARQLPNGDWTSKLGNDVDISHSLNAIESMVYGRATVFLKRKRPPLTIDQQ